MAKIVIIQGHPDRGGRRLCHGLASAYGQGARSAGHSVVDLDIASLEFPLLRSQDEWLLGAGGTPHSLVNAQSACAAADHLVLIYPLWLGTMPALLKGFLEQVLRPGVALAYGEGLPKPLLSGKSARVIITMGMPALAYRWYFFAHSLKSLERNILGFVGIKPVRSTLFGSVDAVDEKQRSKWLRAVAELGRLAR